MKADKIIYSNLIYTGKGRETFDGGVAIKGDRIMAVGPREETEAYADEGTEVFAYEDKLGIPRLQLAYVVSTGGEPGPGTC